MKPLAMLVMLLAITTSAYAECSWVLWEDTVRPKDKTSTEPVRAYNTKHDCDRAVSGALADFRSSPGVSVRKDAKYQEAYVTIGKSTTSYHYACRPDIVDPRGAKRK